MVKLFCALVGVKGKAFSVTIDASESVDDLKDKIAEKQKYDFAASKLQLFLAKNGDDTWLESSTDDVKKLKKGEKTALIEALTHEDNELDGEFGLEEVLEEMPEPKSKQIHVLVVVPEGATSEHDSLSLLREASPHRARPHHDEEVGEDNSKDEENNEEEKGDHEEDDEYDEEDGSTE
ncbi:Crinkler (CRN) family protein [Phytophthora cinnamomi]|uniref:Crinkler (CRN) family protein n=1 Tax=Phytophthora cinnamomi TaxID=4785 RepID=UPI002B30B109|nr:Crinkler (CRN) family protein [Phytophthora cinnamomi]WNO07218.1 CRN effector protein [Phytophthora cinnamomi]